MARKSRKHLRDKSNEPKAIANPKVYYAGIYVRTSSAEMKGNSIENQQKIAEQYIQENTDIELYKTYIDYGISSFDRNRPSFEDMLLDLQSNVINCVIVKDISRFSRDDIEAGDLLQHKFPLWDVRFISVNDNFDSLYGNGTQMRIMLTSLLAYWYSIGLSQKIQKVFDYKQKTGTYISARLPYGYKKIRTGQNVEWIIDDEIAPIIWYIFKQALSDLSAYAIAGKLNEQYIPAPNSRFWTSGSVLRVLRNMSYIGALVTGKTKNYIMADRKVNSQPPNKWIRHDNHHAPIIDDITFYSVQRKLSKRRSGLNKQIPTQSTDFFGGRLYCGICGRKMRRKNSGNGRPYYVCPRRDESASSCPNKAKSEAKLKKQVYSILSNQITEYEDCYQNALSYEKSPYFLRKTDEQEKLIKEYENEIERQNRLFITLYEKYVSNGQINNTDIHELLQYLAKVRSMLKQNIGDIIQSREDYQRNETLGSEKYLLYLKYHECNELTEEMLCDMVGKVLVDLDGVRMIM